MNCWIYLNFDKEAPSLQITSVFLDYFAIEASILLGF